MKIKASYNNIGNYKRYLKVAEAVTNYLNRCRKKRNRIEYESVGGVNSDEISELISFVSDLLQTVEKWMYSNHPELM